MPFVYLACHVVEVVISTSQWNYISACRAHPLTQHGVGSHISVPQKSFNPSRRGTRAD